MNKNIDEGLVIKCSAGLHPCVYLLEGENIGGTFPEEETRGFAEANGTNKVPVFVVGVAELKDVPNSWTRRGSYSSSIASDSFSYIRC